MKIAVLMSTYNGEKYLKEQIESILTQKLCAGCELVLFIRDDGSADQTCNIIQNYTKRNENIICITSQTPAHVGLKESFLLALENALDRKEKFDYYAFSDQDDVWLEDKLTTAIEKLENSDNKKGALYYSNKFIVDNELHLIEEENIHYYGDFPEILWTSFAAGNTMVFNDCLAKYATLYHSQVANYHDAWVYRLAKCIGSDIVFDKNPHIYYRLHSNNVCGRTKSHSSWGKMVKTFIPKLTKPREHFFQNQLKEISVLYRAELDQRVLKEIDLVLNYNKNIKSKWALLTISEIRKRPILDRCIWAYKILFNMI